ncbi:dioxygenase family protein [Sphingobium sp. YR768]|jgi:catechol 1,2-dioxygenase|uniref:dioxygenase family protein n=1 Tax=Sphingobium sp. YR768 TaxID=1884365 RepID=UPI0008BD7B71|nr:dioxygenase [Sphingobium sp. YR768]SER29432.1 catechol 1,2-dioxygenase [Sphingobium sp. YR768]
MGTSFVETPEIQNLLDRVAGLDTQGGDDRLKAIMRDLIESCMTIIARYDVSEDEVWNAVNFLQGAAGAGELGLLMPGVGLEHFIDLYLDAKDAEAGKLGGTPRTIEGPLYVEDAPIVESGAYLTDDADDTETLYMTGRIMGPDGEAVTEGLVHVWHADSHGFYSHFDPTHEQTPFNNRRRLKIAADGTYAFSSKMPNGYSVPPGGASDTLMKALGRHGNRPAHVHFFIEAPGYRRLTTQINFGDDPFAADDFAFGTREGLLPVPNRQGDSAHIAFDFHLQRSDDKGDEVFSTRKRLVVDAVEPVKEPA